MTTPHEQPQHECRCEFCKERLCNGECVFGLRINPPQPSKEGEVRIEDILRDATFPTPVLKRVAIDSVQSLLKEERERLIGVVEGFLIKNPTPERGRYVNAAIRGILTTLNKEKD